jgi:hypothetical protein
LTPFIYRPEIEDKQQTLYIFYKINSTAYYSLRCCLRIIVIRQVEEAVIDMLLRLYHLERHPRGILYGNALVTLIVVTTGGTTSSTATAAAAEITTPSEG